MQVHERERPDGERKTRARPVGQQGEDETVDGDGLGENQVEDEGREDLGEPLGGVRVELPGLDGRETCRNLKKEYPEIKILFCSGYPEDTMARSLVAEGADGYLVKPMRMETLANEIRNTLEGIPKV